MEVILPSKIVKNKKKHAGGRPTVMTKEIINKLEEVFAIGGSDDEACFYADISKQTLYDYQKRFPEFVDRKEALKKRPILKARQTVVKGLGDDRNAQWYLERKVKDEFSQRTETDVTTKGEKITTDNQEKANEALMKFINGTSRDISDKPTGQDTPAVSVPNNGQRPDDSREVQPVE